MWPAHSPRVMALISRPRTFSARFGATQERSAGVRCIASAQICSTLGPTGGNSTRRSTRIQTARRPAATIPSASRACAWCYTIGHQLLCFGHRAIDFDFERQATAFKSWTDFSHSAIRFQLVKCWLTTLGPITRHTATTRYPSTALGCIGVSSKRQPPGGGSLDADEGAHRGV